jgi:Zn-dependent protease
MENNIIQTLAVMILPLLFAITLHEAAHGYVAYLLGDKTAYMLGRVSLNPAKHIDPVGTIAVPALMFFLGGFIFGWAKPVPVTWQNLRRPKLDMALVAIAGPAANLLMAFLWVIIVKISYVLLDGNIKPGIWGTTLQFLYLAGNYGITINLLLMILNLLPIPPLDGSRIVTCIIPPKWDYYYSRLEGYGLWILLALLFLGLLHKIILPPVYIINNLLHTWFGLPLQ